MQSIDLSAERRAQLGTRAARRLRREGRLPAVVYGHHQEVLNVTVPLTEALRHVQDGAHLFSLKIDGAVEQVLLKDVQYDHLGSEILHLDLFRVNLDEEITSEVAIDLFGEPAALKVGGTLTQTKHNLEVICKVRDIPEELRVDVSKMEIGDALHVSDIVLPPGVRLADPDEAEVTIATLAEQKAEEELAPAEEGPAEPEIIGRKAEEEPAEGEAPAKED
jgi:large subunit ribosomal protein L25